MITQNLTGSQKVFFADLCRKHLGDGVEPSPVVDQTTAPTQELT
jgi:hypothetical protein